MPKAGGQAGSTNIWFTAWSFYNEVRVSFISSISKQFKLNTGGFYMLHYNILWWTSEGHRAGEDPGKFAIFSFKLLMLSPLLQFHCRGEHRQLLRAHLLQGRVFPEGWGLHGQGFHLPGGQVWWPVPLPGVQGPRECLHPAHQEGCEHQQRRGHARPLPAAAHGEELPPPFPLCSPPLSPKCFSHRLCSVSTENSCCPAFSGSLNSWESCRRENPKILLQAEK